MNLKKALLECECCICPGCCMPVDGGGNPIDIPFEITAPSCPAIDGQTGVFEPLAIQGTEQPCGVCGQWGYNAVFDVPGCAWQGAEGVPCACDVPCDIQICLELFCSSEFGEADPSSGADNCCKRMRLKIGSSMKFPGSNPLGLNEMFSTLCTEGDYIAPTACDCDGGLTASFSLASLQTECDELYVGGYCDGFPVCCELSGCDFTGATLDI